MSSTKLVATVLQMKTDLTDSEFRLLMTLSECPEGEAFRATTQYLEYQANFTYDRTLLTVDRFGRSHIPASYGFIIYIEEAKSDDYDFIVLEWL